MASRNESSSLQFHSTAIVLVDPYNDFLHHQGKLYPVVEESLVATNTISHLKTLVSFARELKKPILYALHKTWKEGNYRGWSHLTVSHKRVDNLKSFEEGSWGAEILEGLEPDLDNQDVITSQHWNSRCMAHRVFGTFSKVNREFILTRSWGVGLQIPI